MKNYKKIFIFLVLSILSFSPLLANDTRTLIDMAGRKVSLPKNIKTVITLGSVPVLNSFIMAMGEGAKIQNGLPGFADNPRWKYQYIFAPNIKNKPNYQASKYQPLIEKLLKARPQVIFVLHKKIADILEPKGLKVVVLQWKSAADARPAMQLLGKIFHKENQAKAYLKYFEGAVNTALKLTKNIAIDKRPRVLYTYLSELYQPVLMAEWWIKTAGGISVTDNGRKENRYTFSMEQLLAWNPDILILAKPSDYKLLLSDKRFASLKALKNKKVFVIPTVAHTWGHCTVEQPLSVLWALNKFYPKLYSTSMLRKEVHYFYKNFFKSDLSKSQLFQIIP